MDRRGISRRAFLVSSSITAAAGAAGAWWAWRSPEEPELASAAVVIPSSAPLALTRSGKLLDTDFPDPFAGGQLLGYLPFLFEDKGEFRDGLIVERGHNARRCIDVASLLTPEGRKTPAGFFYVRTGYPDQLDPPDQWTIKIHGEVKKPQELPLKSLSLHVKPMGSVLLECSGNARGLKFGLMSVADWAGIPFQKIVDLAQPTQKAKAVLIGGFDGDSTHPFHPPPYRTHSWPTCSWIFTFEQLADAGAFLATELNGYPLPRNQGAPVRLVVPGWYGCSEVKWLNEVKFVDNDQPATLQMQEFAGRTFQDLRPGKLGRVHPLIGPEMARDHRPGAIDQTVLPVRVEQWMLGGKLAYRVVGITWGGRNRTEKLLIRFNQRRPSKFVPVQFCAAKTSNREYGVWCHEWIPRRRGLYWIDLKLEDPSIPTRKMSQRDQLGPDMQIGFCNRAVAIPAV